MADYAQALGRVLLSTVFIVFGFLQFTNIATYIANPAVIKAAGMSAGLLSPKVIAYLIAAIDLFGGLMILLGLQTRWVAVVLIGFILMTIIFVHNFWTMEGAARATNQAHFYKNLGLIGGLIFLILLGSGRYSLDHRFSRG